MNVGIMTPYPEPIGFNHGVLQFCVQAAAHGINPVLIALTRHPLTDPPLVIEAKRLGITVATVHEEFRYDPRAFGQLVELIDRHELELLDAQTYKPLALGLYARFRRPKVALVSWMHGFTQENLKIRLFSTAERFLHRFSDRVVCVSRPFAATLAAKGIDSGKIDVIANAIGDEEFAGLGPAEELAIEFEIPSATPVVGAIGRLSPEKGHLLLVRAWERIHQQMPEAKLLLVGDGPLRGELEQLVRELKLDGSVVFAGFRPDGRRFFGLFDIMVLPSLAEGLPYVLLEAMIREVAVVASAVGEVPEVLLEGSLGKLVPPGDVDALADRVVVLLRDGTERHRLAAAARTSVMERYSHAARTRAIAEVYGLALAGKGSAGKGSQPRP